MLRIWFRDYNVHPYFDDVQIIPVTVRIVKNYDQGSINTETHLVNESEHFKVFSCFSEMQSCLELNREG